MLVNLEDKRSYALRILPADDANRRDDFIRIIDDRPDFFQNEDPNDKKQNVRRDFAPANYVSGLMREMILVAEFGKRGRIKGYKRSNRYAGERQCYMTARWKQKLKRYF